MKNSKFKNGNFRAFFGLLLILTFSVSIFGQETEASPTKTKDNAEKEDKTDNNSYYRNKIYHLTNDIARYDDKNSYKDKDSYGYYYLFEERGVAYFNIGDYNSALNDFNFAIKNWELIKSYLYRGKIYEKKGNYESALSDYFLVVNRNSGLLDEAYLGIGNINRYKRNYEVALENYNQSIFFGPRLSSAYFGRAVVYLELGKILNQSKAEDDKSKAIRYFKDALKDFDSVFELSVGSNNAETYLRRSQVYRQLSETEKADADFQKYNELDEATKIKPL